MQALPDGRPARGGGRRPATLNRHHPALADLDRPWGEAFAKAGAGDAFAVQGTEQGPVAGAEDVPVIPGQVAVVKRREGPAGMGAAIHIAADLFADADHDAGEHGGLRPEAEAPGAGFDDLLKGAEIGPGGGPGGVAAQARAPRVIFMAEISTRSKTPAVL